MGVVDVGIHEAHGGAVHLAVDAELVHRVAGPGSVHAARAEALVEGGADHRRHHDRAAGGAHEMRERLRPVAVDQLSELARDLADRLVPADLLEAIADALQGMQDAVGAVLRRTPARALHARIALGDDVFRIRADCLDAVVLDVDLEAASRFTDPAERDLRLDAHDASPLAWPPETQMGEVQARSCWTGEIRSCRQPAGRSLAGIALHCQAEKRQLGFSTTRA